ncbi:hypothetical protein [Gluconacetobacter asukensis]|uniref:Capsule polysaccharide biosynthesis protein n=1 Tax=Gluconacetobacter asukensis TaxID=1017181 RepID=A0A7W4J1W1_9PROT|nr:hypothetical protein [Gluconacetobacter asukensis]MBB2173106.1 hypothetical protein [Gluconacetobacter asukensis]
MTRQMNAVQQNHRRLVGAIEARFDVARWRGGDVDLWPLAATDLFLDMFGAAGGNTAPPPRPFLHRAAASLATPLTNVWKSRKDLRHWQPRPVPADAILLGDGVSLDRVAGSWRDRYGEPVMATLDGQGLGTFLMQPGGLNRLPWLRPTYAANTVAVRAALTAALTGALRPARSLDLPDHAPVLEFLHQEGVRAPSLHAERLNRRFRTVFAAATLFQRILRRVRPRIAFVVTYYAGLGHAFALACRREGILCIDLQHCPQEGHRAYSWHGLPASGYSTLPAMFWCWGAEDVARIADWARAPWHGAIHGGHTQHAAHAKVPGPHPDPAFDREILVALQPIGGYRAVWQKLARHIEASPASWRWWIRRHPSASASQDAEYSDLLALRRPNVIVEEACLLPLTALLERVNVLVSLASGAAVEAAAFGIPALFLDPAAAGAFPGLIERRQAVLADVDGLLPQIAALSGRRERALLDTMPPIAETLQQLHGMAADYARRRMT